MKIVFAGTPFFAAYVLNSIIDQGYDVPLVLTQPDRPSGRGLKINSSEVKKLALLKKLKILQPNTINSNKTLIDFLISINPDVMVVVAYGMLIPKEILMLPRIYAINVHASILPRWRGASPIQRAIQHGDKKSGITIIKMDEGLDTGDILTKQECEILPHYTSLDLHNVLVKLAANQCIFALKNIDRLVPYKQDILGVTYAYKITKKEAKIIWNEDNVCIVRKIKAFNPNPVAWTFLKNNVLKVWDAQIINLNFNLTPGTLLIKDNSLLVQCKSSCIQILDIQLAGARKMSAQDFLKSGKINNNILLE